MPKFQKQLDTVEWAATPDSLAWAGAAPYSPFESAIGLQMPLFSMLFAWWRGATYGTLATTWFSGQKVGTDQYGNRYYQTRDGKRRWVLYNGTVEASRVPPDWHGWLHHTFQDPPSVVPLAPKAWEAGHRPNMTGTGGAYRPEGSLARSGVRPPATGDYQPWKPE